MTHETTPRTTTGGPGPAQASGRRWLMLQPGAAEEVVVNPAWQAQSLSLSYPDDDLVARLPLLRRVAAAVPSPVGAPLDRFLDHVATTPLPELAAEYVTYFAYGDTRKRGMALLRFKHAYRAAGLTLDDATVGERLMVEHRAGLELMRLGLHNVGSPWAHVLDSVSATLPPLDRHEHDKVARLAAEGPPEEEVGLAPFAPPEYMPTGGTR